MILGKSSSGDLAVVFDKEPISVAKFKLICEVFRTIVFSIAIIAGANICGIFALFLLSFVYMVVELVRLTD